MTPEQLAAAVRSAKCVAAVGGGTKPRLAAADGAEPISVAGLRGIVEYEPSEFTFTALGGTPLREIVAVLAEKGQYLPWDPPLVAAGATLGGAIASGLNGPGRFRYGGLRDFILGVRLIDGEGRLLRLGGKVVKNAAGFDVPKLLVGSLGRLGLIAEATLKVFPRPAATATVRWAAADVPAMTAIFAAAGKGRWEIDALEAAPGEGAVYARLGAPEAALAPLVRDLLGRWPGRELPEGEADALWSSVLRYGWAHPDGSLFKVVTTPASLPALGAGLAQTPHARWWVGAAGNAAYVSLPAADAGQEPMLGGLPALRLRGAGPLWVNPAPRSAVMLAVKRAFDPAGRFPPLDA